MSVFIRPYQPDDAVPMYEAARESVETVFPWMPWCHPQYNLDDARSWIERQTWAFQSAEAFEFVIVSADGTFLGGCGLNQLDMANPRANLGYWVRSTAARQGVATAAAKLIVEWAFRNVGLIRIEAVIAVGNVASLRVAEKAGAVREGILRSRLLLHGVMHDAVMFSFVQ